MFRVCQILHRICCWCFKLLSFFSFASVIDIKVVFTSLIQVPIADVVGFYLSGLRSYCFWYGSDCLDDVTVHRFYRVVVLVVFLFRSLALVGLLFCCLNCVILSSGRLYRLLLDDFVVKLPAAFPFAVVSFSFWLHFWKHVLLSFHVVERLLELTECQLYGWLPNYGGDTFVMFGSATHCRSLRWVAFRG